MVVVLEKVKEKVEVLMEFWSLWWFKWRWRRRKMMVGSWRSYICCGYVGDEGRVDGGCWSRSDTNCWSRDDAKCGSNIHVNTHTRILV